MTLTDTTAATSAADRGPLQVRGEVFSIKNAEISAAMMDRKLAAIEASGADRLVSCDLGCLMHLEGGLRRRGASIQVQHLAELLDEAATP